MKYLKKISRGIYFLAVLFIIFAGLRDVTLFNSEVSPVVSEGREKVVLPIIMYHSFLKDPRSQGKYVLPPSLFEEDLKYLEENGYETVTVADLVAYYENGKPLPEKPVMLTFDDGYYNNYVYAYPLLKKYNAKAVLSIIGICSEKFSESNDENANYSHVTWDEIKEMSDSGLVEIQNHSDNLHTRDKGRKGARKKQGENELEYQNMLEDDLSKLQELLYEHCGIIPTAFAYPFGAVSDASIPVIKKMGFKASFTCLQRINILESEEDLMLMNRFLRTGDNSEKFFSSLGLEKYYGKAAAE